jgi:hypothetical protein
MSHAASVELAPVKLMNKPADLPVRYRDFKVYSTSAPDPANPTRIVLTVQLRNEGKKPLRTHVRLAPNAKAGGRLAGLTWQGRTLTGRDRLPPAEVHYLAHVVVGQEWPPGTTLADYLDSIRGVVLDPRSGVLTSRLYGEWQLAVVRRSGPLRGPQGYEWLMVEYRVSITSWATAHQLRAGLSAITQSPNRQGVRWLRQPN